MRMLNARYAMATLAIGGFATTAGFFGQGVAGADLIDGTVPLLTSTCSFAQVAADLHAVAPESAARLDASPFQKAVLQSAFDQPADQREAVFEPLVTQRLSMGAKTEAATESNLIQAEVGPIMLQVADSCHSY